MLNSFIAPEGWAYIILAGCLAFTAYFINFFLFIPVFILFCFVTFFFRNPERKVPSDDNIIVSAADGVVLSVEEIDEPEFLKGRGIKISVFLSIFNVHVNRAPVSGTIAYNRYIPGKFVSAFREDAPKLNERNIIGIEYKGTKVLVIQIAGLVARRIVFKKKVGDTVDLGERIGMIKFGSCTQVIVPTDTKVFVKPGDKVKAGITVIGRLKK